MARNNRKGRREGSEGRNRKLRFESLESRQMLAGDPYLVKDIFGVDAITAAYAPHNFAEVNGVLYFRAYDAAHGFELWRSDGTPEGTKLVVDLTPGINSSTLTQLTNIGGTLYFSGPDEEPMKSDGTATGTVLVKDINPTFRGSKPKEFTSLGGLVYFSVSDGSSIQGLWKSDGTPAGTEQIWYGSVTGLTNVNGVLFFSGNNSDATRSELWKSDGTAGGTTLVKDINPGAANSTPRNLTNFNGTLYFFANDGTTGYELWRSNGQDADTTRVKDINPGLGYSLHSELTKVSGELFFTASDGITGHELWKSDGTEAGTVLVKDIAGGSGQQGNPIYLTNVGGILYFSANDSAGGQELWKSDGTLAGTIPVADLGPNPTPAALTNLAGTLYFTANDGVHGRELWKSDGTAAGTVLVRDLLSGPANGATTAPFAILGGRVFFQDSAPGSSSQFWKSDGTAAGTVIVGEVDEQVLSSSPFLLTNVGGTLYFRASDGTTGVELWKSDGTVGGTIRVKDIRPGADGSNVYSLTNVGGLLYFSADDGTSGLELWKSDGTGGGTVRVKDIRPGAGGSVNRSLLETFTNVGGTLYFRASDGTSGYELWKSDGTEAGTVRVKDINPGLFDSTPASLTNVGGTLYFIANNGTDGSELWKSDGTEAGTVRVKDINPGGDGSLPGSSISKYLTNVGGTLYFGANDGTSGFELWKSDGTEAGTIRVKDISPGVDGSLSNFSIFESLTNVGGTLYFEANDGTSGSELWKSDGTEAGTVRFKDINPGLASSGPFHPTNVGGTLYFGANDGTSGSELWKSDGTEAGTVRVKDINPGLARSRLNHLTNVGGTLYFRADDGTTGSELWKSDGTEAGTVRVQDINPGVHGISELGNPDLFTNVGGTLYFQANDGTTGIELWALDTKTPLPGDYDRNGLIQQADHTFWAANFGATTGLGLQADGNGNGVVDAADYNIWRDNFTPPPTSVAVASSAVSAAPLAIPTPISASPARRAALIETATASMSQSNRTSELLAARDAAFAELGRASYEEVRASRRVMNSRGPTVREVPGTRVTLELADARRRGP